jgi:hypothetical protein
MCEPVNSALVANFVGQQRGSFAFAAREIRPAQARLPRRDATIHSLRNLYEQIQRIRAKVQTPG